MILPLVSFPFHLPSTAPVVTSALAFPSSSQTLLNSPQYGYSQCPLASFPFCLGQPLAHFHLLSAILRSEATHSAGAQQLWGTSWLFTYRKGKCLVSGPKFFSLPVKNRLAKTLSQTRSSISWFCFRDDPLRYLFSLFYVLLPIPLLGCYQRCLVNTSSPALTYSEQFFSPRFLKTVFSLSLLPSRPICSTTLLWWSHEKFSASAYITSPRDPLHQNCLHSINLFSSQCSSIWGPSLTPCLG